MNRPAEAPSVALAHHWMMSMRGGEKTLAVIAASFPDAPIYTLLARRKQLTSALTRRDIRTSFLQRFGPIPNLQRKALPLLAPASRSLDASGFDAVICSDAAVIKAIRTHPEALKICYCHSPMRYVWDLYEQYLRDAGPLGRIGLRRYAPRLRETDRRAADTVTAFIANSHAVADRIRRCYGRASVVIPPPVETDQPPNLTPPDDFYLVVAEQVGYKRTDLAVDACTRLGRDLVVIGTGPMLDAMRRRAGRSVRFLGWQEDEAVRDHMRRCRALLFCGEEDFGMVPVEVQAAGRSVIALARGGALDTVVDGQTGILFDEPEVDAVVQAIERLENCQSLLPPEAIQASAARFSVEQFRARFEQFYDWSVRQWREGSPARVRDLMERGDSPITS